MWITTNWLNWSLKTTRLFVGGKDEILPASKNASYQLKPFTSGTYNFLDSLLISSACLLCIKAE